MKDGIDMVRKLARNLVNRLEDVGDPTFLRKANLELEDKLTTVKGWIGKKILKSNS